MNSSVAGDVAESAVRVAITKETDRICGFCGKRFGSGNALGGHMRIHNRVLNMIKEDANDVKKKLISSGEEEEMISCSICGKNFWSWKSMTAHRHLAVAYQVSSSASLSSTVSENQVQDSDSTDVVGPTADLAKCLSSGWSVTGKRARKLVASLEPRTSLFKKKIRKLSDFLEENSISSLKAPKKKKKSYGCSHCHMSFPTYQALGGHVSKHRRRQLLEKSSTANNSSIADLTKNNELVTNKNGSNKQSSDTEEILTASCSDELGLHDSAGAEADEHGRRKSLIIDLNEPPPMEDGEQGILRLS